jgi:hypothetical protein
MVAYLRNEYSIKHLFKNLDFYHTYIVKCKFASMHRARRTPGLVILG